jgi:DNA-binding transcriptional LysR family regulator
VEESLEALFRFRRGILPQLRGVPFIEQESPAVCAWYPGARAVLVWNLAEHARRLTVRLGDAIREVDVDGLGVALVPDVG